MAGDPLLLVQDIDPEGIGLEHQVLARFVGRHRVAVGLELDLAVPVEGHRTDHTAVKVALRQWTQAWAFFCPHLANGPFLTVDGSTVVGLAASQQEFVELGERVDTRNGDHKVATAKPDTAFHTPFLVSLSGGTEMTLEQVVAAKDDKGALLLAIPPFQDPCDRRLEIVVADPVRDATETVKGLHVSVKKRFLFLGRIGHDKQLAGVVEAHGNICTVTCFPAMMATASPQSTCASAPGSNSRGRYTFGRRFSRRRWPM